MNTIIPLTFNRYLFLVLKNDHTCIIFIPLLEKTKTKKIHVILIYERIKLMNAVNALKNTARKNIENKDGKNEEL